jgi:hypothetical protein
MIKSTFEIKTINDLFILLIDLDQRRSVTNDAPNVIEYLEKNVQGGYPVPESVLPGHNGQDRPAHG